MTKKNAKLDEVIIVPDEATGLLAPLQRAANERGHGRQTKASGVGGFIGAVIGSFGGPLGAAIGAATGAGIGYLIADENAAEPGA